jgi:hypothetical protein
MDLHLRPDEVVILKAALDEYEQRTLKSAGIAANAGFTAELQEQKALHRRAKWMNAKLRRLT